MAESAEGVFARSQQRLLDSHGVDARSISVDVPSIEGRAQVLVAGEGADVVMLNGIGTPAAMWAPLMARLPGLRLHAVDLPGYGLTHAPPDFSRHLRRNAVAFLQDVLTALNIDRPGFVTNSLGSLWACWLALDRPQRVRVLSMVGCPALALGSSAPLPMRLMSVRPVGRLLSAVQPPSPKQVEQLGRMVGQHPLQPELAALLEATERLPAFQTAFLPMLNRVLRLRGARPDIALGAGDLARIDTPTQLFWGDRDPFAPRRLGQRIADVMPCAEFHLVRGGHTPWLTDARTIAAAAARFLDGASES